MGALGLALTADGWNIDITNNDVTNLDVDIYKIPQNDACEVTIAYSGTVTSSSNLMSGQALYNSIVASPPEGFTQSARPEAAKIISDHYKDVFLKSLSLTL